MRKANKAAFTSRRYRELMQNNRFECYKHMDANPSEDVEICPHHHAFYEIIFIVEGDFYYEVEGRPYHLSRGDVILIDELQFHRGLINHSQGYERYALWIHPKYMQRLAKRFPKLDPQYCFLQLNSDNNNILHLDDASFSELNHDLSRLFLSFWSKTPSDEVLSESYFAIILTKLNQIVHRMQAGEEIPTISATSMNHSESAIDITSKAFAAVYNQPHALGSSELLEQYAPDGYITPAAQSPLITHPEFHSAPGQSHEVVSAVEIANSGITGHAEAKGEHIDTAQASSVTEGMASYNSMGTYELNSPERQRADAARQAAAAAHVPNGGAHTADSAYLSVSGHQDLSPNLASLPQEMIEKHRAALPSNIASTGRRGSSTPYGFGYRSTDNLHSALEALNFNYDEDKFLNAGVAATLSLVSFASSLGTNVHNPPAEDISIFDVDPESDDNYVLNEGGIPNDGTEYQDVYVDTVAHAPHHGQLNSHAHDDLLTAHANEDPLQHAHPHVDSLNRTQDGHLVDRSVMSCDSYVQGINYDSTQFGPIANSVRYSHSRTPNAILSADSVTTSQALVGRLKRNKDSAAAVGLQQDGKFHTLLMQAEGATPAPIREHQSALNKQANVQSSPVASVHDADLDYDEMNLDIKLSERLKLSALLQHINLHINENLSLDELAQRFNLSKFYLTRRFKELTGLSLHQFIVKKRLTRARYLISVGTDPYCAAVEAGFNNYSHFSRTFKAYFGQNPSTIPQANKLHEGVQDRTAPVTKVNETRPSPDHLKS